MHIAECSDHLEFDDDLVLDYQVGGEFANDHVIVKDDNPPLLGGAEPGLSRLVGKDIPIDHFSEPAAERIANPESTPNDPRRSATPTTPQKAARVRRSETNLSAGATHLPHCDGAEVPSIHADIGLPR
jgi:hypothetical protein